MAVRFDVPQRPVGQLLLSHSRQSCRRAGDAGGDLTDRSQADDLQRRNSRLRTRLTRVWARSTSRARASVVDRIRHPQRFVP